MGHLINPVGFRLGTCRFWNFVWMNSLNNRQKYSYFIGYDHSMLDFFNRIFNLPTVLKFGFIFSHLKSFKVKNKNYYFIYFFEGSSHQKNEIFYNFIRKWGLKIIKKALRKHAKIYKLKKKIKQKRNINRKQYLRILRIRKIKKKLKKSLIKYFIKLKKKNKFFTLSYLKYKFSNKEIKYFKKIFYKIKMNYKSKSKLLKRKKKNFFLKFKWGKKKFFFRRLLYQFKLLTLINLKKIKSFKSLNKFYLLNFLYNKINYKKAVCYLQNFIIQNFKNSLFKDFTISNFFLKKNTIMGFYKKKKLKILCLYLLKQKQLLLKLKKGRIKNKLVLHALFKFFIKNFLKQQDFLRNYPKLFLLVRNIWFFYVKGFLNKYKKKLFLGNNKVHFYFKPLDNDQVSAEIISRYICIRLKQRFFIKQILNTIIPHLVQNKTYLGFKISCAGRFSKNEIAVYQVKKGGSMHLTSFSNFVDYSFNEIILKYSICSIKVWLNRKPFLYRKLLFHNTQNAFITT